MPESASPFTIDSLAALLHDDGVRFSTAEDGTVYLRFGCDRVPHELRIVVNERVGYCSITQHDLGLVVASLAGEQHAGDACRLALMLNGEALFGSFMLWGYQGTALSYGIVLPTTDAELTLGQIQTAIGAVCHEVDLCYPLLQQVLWAVITPEQALAEYRAQRRVDDANSDGDGASDVGALGGEENDQSALPVETDAAGRRRRPPAGAQNGGSAALDRIDDAFLGGYDRDDPFSATVADAILRLRRDDAAGEGDSSPA